MKAIVEMKSDTEQAEKIWVAVQSCSECEFSSWPDSSVS